MLHRPLLFRVLDAAIIIYQGYKFGVPLDDSEAQLEWMYMSVPAVFKWLPRA